MYLPRIPRRTWISFVICVLIGGGLLGFGLLSNSERTVGYAHSPENLLRLHVIPHSDAPAEQNVKLLVRDVLLQEMRRWNPPGSKEELEQTLRANHDRLRLAALETLKGEGFDHDVRVEIGNFVFDERQAGGLVFPAGQYEAVRIIIGAGAGKNWWCVLFPPLCFMDEDVEVQFVPSANPVEEEELQVRFRIWEFISESAYVETIRERWLASLNESQPLEEKQ